MQASYITELRALVRCLKKSKLTDAQKELLNGVEKNLDDAWLAAHHGFRSAEECVYTNICSAETGLLRVVPEPNLPDWVPIVRQAVRTYLPESHEVRQTVEAAIKRSRRSAVSRQLLVNGLTAAYYADSVEKRRASSFRNIVMAGTAVLFVLAASLVFTAYGDQPLVRLCFPENNPKACPTGFLSAPPRAVGAVTARASATAAATAKATAASDPDPGTAAATTTARATAIATTNPNTQSPPSDADSTADPPDQEFFDILIVEIFGLMAAALTAAVALGLMNRTRPPYKIPLALALLKLPAGAVSAVIGVTLINAGVIPGLDKLETPAQILSWAALFGAGQQALTRFVDKKGREVLQFPGSVEEDRSS